MACCWKKAKAERCSFFPSEHGPRETATPHNECSPYSPSVSQVSQCVIASSAKVIDSLCLGPSGQCLVHTYPQIFLSHLTAKNFFLILEVLPRHALKFHEETTDQLQPPLPCAFGSSVPQSNAKAEQKESCPLAYGWEAGLKTAVQDFWMPSQLGTVENLSVLLPAPELGHSHKLFSLNRGLTLGIRELCLYVHAHRLFGYRTVFQNNLKDVCRTRRKYKGSRSSQERQGKERVLGITIPGTAGSSSAHCRILCQGFPH